jgi:DNA-binding transcriptional MerR regulator
VRIGDVAAGAGVSTRALRYYEEQGLLTSERSPSGQRHYADDAVARVRWIQALYSAGLSSKAITTDSMLARMTEERDRIDAQIAGLTATRERLHALITAAADGAPKCDLSLL